MAKPAPKRKSKLGPKQIDRLNKRVRDIREGFEPERAAAELAEHMRRYQLKVWNGITLRAADEQANTLLYCSQVYHGGRHWHAPQEEPSWLSGHSLLVLYTPSVERGLVLRHTACPTWSDIKINTGLHYMPRHPGNGSFIRLEAHWHQLPTRVRNSGMTGYNWDQCCERKALHPDITESVTKLTRFSSIATLRDAMVKVWQQVHGPARPSWE